LPFEEPLIVLEQKIAELKGLEEEQDVDRGAEIAALEEQALEVKKRIFADLSPWDKVQLARHPRRPYTLDYLRLICDDFVELHGDRRFGDDGAIVATLARIGGRTVAAIGQERGRTTRERQKRNFGSPHPEGYRKAVRVMKLAEKLGHPVVTLIDTSGAACLEEDESRGISEAIASAMLEMSRLRVPIVCVVIGEGGSGGAIGIGVGDRILMLEYSTYSVIAPEGCAAIIWRESSRAAEAARLLRVTAEEAVALGVADGVIPEPLGGAHRDCMGTAENIKAAVLKALDELCALPVETLLSQRYQKYRNMGLTAESKATKPAQGAASANASKPKRGRRNAKR